MKTKKFELLEKNSHFTDDTVMTVAVADSVMNGVPYLESLQKWGRKYPRAGYGSWFKKWIHLEKPMPYNSFGNGSAMRCSSIGWLFDDEESVLNEAKKSAEITHNHPEGIKGAQAVALGVLMGRMGSSKKETKEKLESLFDYDLSQKLEQIRPSYTFDSTCQGSVPQAIIAFLESTDFEDAIRNSISLGGDADTQACITGSLAEAHYKIIPAEISSFVRWRIEDDLLAVLDQFNSITK
jgi:ADP-ribosylglycohydrolase